MGCTSSTEVVTDPHTGQVKQKHKMGGSYPGNRRVPQEQYQPNGADFNKQGQATAHFVSYGGGNALVLQQPGGGGPGPAVGSMAIPLAKQPQYVQVTLPEGVHAGQKIHVQAPSGALNEIVVPEGFGPGSTFTVEFADTPSNVYPTTYPTPQQYQPYTSTSNYPTAAASPMRNDNSTANAGHDDGFASGFGNPDFVPGPRVVAPAFASVYGNDNGHNNGNNNYDNYPMAQSDAKAIYSSAY